jgi:hypothetical protein
MGVPKEVADLYFAKMGKIVAERSAQEESQKDEPTGLKSSRQPSPYIAPGEVQSSDGK